MTRSNTPAAAPTAAPVWGTWKTHGKPEMAWYYGSTAKAPNGKPVLIRLSTDGGALVMEAVGGTGVTGPLAGNARRTSVGAAHRFWLAPVPAVATPVAAPTKAVAADKKAPAKATTTSAKAKAVDGRNGLTGKTTAKAAPAKKAAKRYAKGDKVNGLGTVVWATTVWTLFKKPADGGKGWTWTAVMADGTIYTGDRSPVVAEQARAHGRAAGSIAARAPKAAKAAAPAKAKAPAKAAKATTAKAAKAPAKAANGNGKKANGNGGTAPAKAPRR